MALYTFPIRAGSEKIMQGFPDGPRSDRKTRFFYISSMGWKHDEGYPSLNDVKYYITRPVFFSMTFPNFTFN